jgi:hypothetical protein
VIRVLRIAGRIALALAGLIVIAYLVWSAGPARVGETLWEARAWLPLIAALECAPIASDYFTLRVLLGRDAQEVPAATWLRSSTLAYAMMICLPAGRAAGEVTRASLLARHLGAARAASASTRLQVAYVFAIGVLAAIEAATAALRFGIRAPLALLLAGTSVLMMAFAGALFSALRDARFRRWVDRIRRLVTRSETAPTAAGPEAPRNVPLRAVLICCASRTAQALQYGIILVAVGGVASVHGALIAHGIEIVGSTLGEFLPNQIGVVDTTYRTFALDVGFASVPARALSIALLARLARLLVAATCITVAAASRRAADAESPPDGETARPSGARRVPIA